MQQMPMGGGHGCEGKGKWEWESEWEEKAEKRNNMVPYCMVWMLIEENGMYAKSMSPGTRIHGFQLSTRSGGRLDGGRGGNYLLTSYSMDQSFNQVTHQSPAHSLNKVLYPLLQTAPPYNFPVAAQCTWHR